MAPTGRSAETARGTEGDWCFSQRGRADTVPLGSWQRAQRQTSEIERDYSQLTLESGGAAAAPDPSAPSAPAERPLAVGERVRVHPGVARPRHKWSPVTARSVGTIVRISGDDLIIKFPEMSGWQGLTSETVRDGEPLRPTAESVTSLDNWLQAAFHKFEMMGFDAEAALAALERACREQATEETRLAAAVDILVQ